MESQIKSGSHARRFPHVRTDIRSVESAKSNGDLIQYRREIQRNRCPGLIFPHILRLGNHPALDTPIFRKGYFRVPYSSALSLTVSYIEQDMAILSGWKCITLNSDTRGSGKLRMDRVIFQENGIITGRSDLVRTVKTRTVSCTGRVVYRPGNRFQRARRRHQDDSTDLELMQTRETLDRLIPIIITGSLPSGFIPNMPVRRRGRLSHAERHRSRGKMKPTAMRRTDPGFYILAKLFLLNLLTLCHAGREKPTKKQEGTDSLHTILFHNLFR